MRNHLLTTVLAAGALLSLAGSARARETQLCGIKLGAQTSVILEDPRFGDPNRISPIYNLFRPPTQAAGGGPGMPGGSSSGGEMGGAAETGTENAGTFLQLLGQGSTGGGGGASSGGGMMSSGSGMGGYPGSGGSGYPGSGGSGYPGSGSGEGSGGMMGMAPAAVRPKQQYEGKIANTRPEIYASWILIPPKMRTIIMMGMSVAMSTAGAQGGMGGASSGGMGGSGSGSGSMMAPGGMMGGSEGGSGGGMMGGGAMSLSQQAVAKIPGAPGAGGMGGGASGMSGGGGQTDPQPIANAWVYEKPADGMTYLFFADGGRVSLIAAGDDKPYSIAKGGRKPVHPGIQTSKGIGLGDTYDKVILTYGWPEATETMGDEIVLRYFGRQGVAFSFKNGVLRVDSIVVKLPGE